MQLEIETTRLEDENTRRGHLPSRAFDQLRDSLETARGIAPVKAAVKEFAGQLGFDWFAYLSVCGPEIDTFSTYPRAWQGHYIHKKYATIDPVVREARRSERCFAWSERDLARALSPDQVRFLGEANEHGIASGISVPVSAGFGRTVLFTLASSNRCDNCLVECPFLAASIASHVDVYARRWMLDPMPADAVRLSPRERLCLSWMAKGKRMSEIAQIVGTKVRTVEYHLQNARRKLDATNVTHAVALAVRQQLI